MLLPALNQARQKAKNISCKNTLKTLAHGYNLYLDTYSEWLPTILLKPQKYFPGHIVELLNLKSDAKKLFVCPGESKTQADISRRKTFYIDYALNRIGASNTGPRAVTLHMSSPSAINSENGKAEGWKRWKLTDITRPSVCVVGGDDGRDSGNAAAYSNEFGYRHNNTGNFFFMDMHIESIHILKARGLTASRPSIFVTGWRTGTIWVTP